MGVCGSDFLSEYLTPMSSDVDGPPGTGPKGYGAVEMGVQRFHHPGHDDTEPVGEGKFIHLWQYKDHAWRITRVISYDHHALVK